MFSLSNSTAKRRVSGETFSIYMPLLIVPLVIWEISVGSSIPYWVGPLALNLLEGVLGSVGHTGLTWALIFMTPEGREWWYADQSKTMRLKVVAVTIGIFLFTTLVFLLDKTQITTVFFALYTIASLHHGMAQVQGLSFAYSYKNAPDAAARPIIERVHRRQKTGFALLLFVACFYPVDSILDAGIINSPARKFMVFAVGAIIAAWLILSNRRLPGSQKNKMIFLARNFNVPLGIYSMFAQLSIRLFHGFEYMFIYRKMILNSGYSKLFSRASIIWASIGLYVFVTFLWLFTFFGSEGLRYFYEFKNDRPWWFAALGSLAVTRALVHFYMDRLIFQMSNPHSRRSWAALLSGAEVQPVPDETQKHNPSLVRRM